MEEKPCVFCQIAAKKIPAKIVYEDENSIAFLDINPANAGHTLLIPKQHFETLMDIPSEQFKELADALQRVAIGLVKAVQSQGLNILQNNREVAGQAMPHAHFHLIPRYKDDGLQLGTLRQGKMDENMMGRVAEKIRASVPPREEKKVEVEEEKPEEKPRSEEEIKLIRRELELT
jgi:histidine triad (HIT) family protein